jgi:hypothetical protein
MATGLPAISRMAWRLHEVGIPVNAIITSLGWLSVTFEKGQYISLLPRVAAWFPEEA